MYICLGGLVKKKKKKKKKKYLKKKKKKKKKRFLKIKHGFEGSISNVDLGLF